MKKIFLAMIICFIFPSLVFAGIYKDYFMAQYSQNLTSALTGIGSTECGLVFHQTVTLTADCNAPDNIVFKFQRGGKINLGNYNLYIQGTFECPPDQQAFNVSGSGRVYFRGSIDRVYPEWFGAVGDGVTNDTNALNYCLLSYKNIESPPGLTYLITASVQYQDEQFINFNGSTIKGNLTSDSLVEPAASGYDKVVIENLTINNTDPNNASSIGLDVNGTQKSRFSNIRVLNVATGIKFRGAAYWNDIYSPNVETTRTGIYFAYLANQCTVYGGNVDHCDIGILIESDPVLSLNNVKIYGTAVEDFTRGIKIIDALWTHIDSPRLETAKALSAGIFLQGDCLYTSIITPHFDGPTQYIDGNAEDVDGLLLMSTINNSITDTLMGFRTAKPVYAFDMFASDSNAPVIRVKKPGVVSGYPRAYLSFQNTGYVHWFMGISGDGYNFYLGSQEDEEKFTFTNDGKLGIGVDPSTALDVNGLSRVRVDARTIADNATGSSPATLTLTPTSSYVAIICNDVDGCNITMGEAGMAEGIELEIVNVSTNACNFADSSGVSELTGAIALGQYDSLTLWYIADRWIQTSTSNN